MDAKHQLELLMRGTDPVRGIVPVDGLLKKLERSVATGKPLKVKLGLDPTAPDIHIGSAVVLRKLRQFQDLGHHVVVIIGDFTAMIGDPTGKSETRKQLTRDEVKANATTYSEQYSRILDPARTEVRFNSEWLGTMDFYDVIRLAARATVAKIMERDDFTNRFREGKSIGLHELLYPLCQAYDSVVLRSDVEMGGTDQMFNILTGRELQVQHGQEPQVAMFSPLLVGTDGTQKMSKSLGNYVGITESPSVMYGKILSITDGMMASYFELATNVPMDEIRALVAVAGSGAVNPKTVKQRLAREIITIYHGADAALAAEAEFEKVHARGEAPTEIPEFLLGTIEARDGRVWICRLLADAGLAPGTGEARRLVQQGGVQVGGARVTDAKAEFAISDLDGAIIQVGSRRFVRARL